jgi:DNA-binding transcriptional MerR regulator
VRQEYTLAQLAAAVGMTERNVRAYRSRGLIRPPRMRGRVGYYDLGHISQLRLVQALTGRGLSLSVVGQLMEKNLAEHELARLIREDLPAGPPLPLSPVVIEELKREDPTLFDAMVEHGLARPGEAGPEADPALLALGFKLAGYGLSAVEVGEVLLAGARAAAAAEEQVWRGVSAAVGRAAPEGANNGVAERDGGAGPRAAAPTPAAAANEATDPAMARATDRTTDRTTDPATARATDPATDASPEPNRKPAAAGTRRADATATTVAMELAAMAFRISLEWRLSRREP